MCKGYGDRPFDFAVVRERPLRFLNWRSVDDRGFFYGRVERGGSSGIGYNWYDWGARKSGRQGGGQSSIRQVPWRGKGMWVGKEKAKCRKIGGGCQTPR